MTWVTENGEFRAHVEVIGPDRKLMKPRWWRRWFP